MTSMQSAFHLRELPLGDQQTSPESLCVCSSHPCRAVSLTHNPADLVYRGPIFVLLKPAAWWMEAENNIKSLYTCSPSFQRHSTGCCSSDVQSNNLRPLKTESGRTRQERKPGVMWSKRSSSVSFMTFMKDLTTDCVVYLKRFFTLYMSFYSFQCGTRPVVLFQFGVEQLLLFSCKTCFTALEKA